MKASIHWGLALAWFVLFAGPLSIRAGEGPNDMQTLAVYVENDLFAKTDRFYTNGVRCTWLSQDIESMDLPQWARRVTGALPPLNRPGYTHNIGLAIGQSIHTPNDIQTDEPIPDDTPYSGWLYGAVSLHHKNERTLHLMELTLGVVGPEALGEEAQNGLHELRSLPTAHGWEHQLDTELGVMLTYECKYRCRQATAGAARFGADLIPVLSLSAGNVLTQAAAGATLRVGHNLPNDFHGTRIRVSGYSLAPESTELSNAGRRLSLFIFGSVEGKAVGRNIFIDGNAFGGGPGVDRKPWVGELELGAGLRCGRYRVTYAQVWRSKEFAEQSTGHQFGSVSVAVSF